MLFQENKKENIEENHKYPYGEVEILKLRLRQSHSEISALKVALEKAHKEQLEILERCYQ